ncbi:MAG: PleD family two-component system response regulator [Acidobacteriota bacterium]
MRDSLIILVIDDSIGVQTAVREALAGERGVEIVCRGDAAGAAAWLRSGRPTAVLCDVLLPDAPGYDVCRRIIEDPRTATTPVFLLSSPFEPFDEDAAARCGAQGVIGKPFTAADLRKRLTPVLTAGSAATATLVDVAPADVADEVDMADVIPSDAPSPSDLVDRLAPVLAEQLLEPVILRLLTAWQDGTIPAGLDRKIGEAAERLVRQRIQELEAGGPGESISIEDAD